ncbi:hypothetical protein F2P56_012365 [Juglans regia]|uniref:Reverse transcriptase n=2 Tax=Juglans regia TaxID=51240 RepID=A0A834CUA7_JUGRE|nr:uncharacterized protein LOC109021580 [Juglans regia]KAF5468190.1 hypothetical protein F2P56_012365 [Juglans regia]
MARCKVKLGFTGCLTVDCQGSSGGLALLWKPEVNLQIINYSSHHIHALIKGEGPHERDWVFSGIYGHSVTASRHETWGLLHHLCRLTSCPWLLMGDFNEILEPNEKRGGNRRSEGLMEHFRAALIDCNLQDLGFSRGPYFTWCNGREGEGCIWERLDRCLASPDWVEAFPNFQVSHGSVSYSDHLPIWLNTEGVSQYDRRKKMFRFESMWVGHEECEAIIKDVWQNEEGRGNMVATMRRVKECNSKLDNWNRTRFGLVHKNLAKAKDKLQTLQEEDPNCVEAENLKAPRKEVQLWLERDELLWKQRSRVLWLHSGDKNSKYLHSKASQRKKRNFIVKLQDSEGRWREGAQRDSLIIDYFQTLFSPSAERGAWDVLEGLEGRLTPELSLDLEREFVAEEVTLVVNQMHPNKAPGPDGMSPLFYQKYWHVLGNDIIAAVLNVLNTGVFPEGFNHTLLVLIPKKKTATQLAFVPGRLITDNVLVAYELVHFLKQKRKGKKGFMSLKLDMSKAYDRVEWDFLEEILLRLGVGLISLLRQADVNQTVTGIKLCRGAPQINHLLFADDSVIFCKADLGYNPSYTWKGIWEARKILLKGCQMRIGNELTARIWEDTWIPGHQALKNGMSLCEGTDMTAKVARLIDSHTGWWDVEQVRALFNPIIVSDILKIVLSPGRYEDAWFWRHEKSENFSVRSAYRFMAALESQNSPENSTRNEDKKLWKALWRNKLIYEKVKENPIAVIHHALSLQIPTSFLRNSPNLRSAVCWNVPPTGFVKLNVDGALFYDYQKASVGAVVRDDHGQVIMAVSKSEPEVSEAEAVELIAMLRGLQFTSQLGFSRIILESDCLILVEGLQADGESFSVSGYLISEVKRMLHLFLEARVQHVPRMGNQVAHCLARHAWRVKDVELWMHSFPDFIAQHVWLDNSLV